MLFSCVCDCVCGVFFSIFRSKISVDYIWPSRSGDSKEEIQTSALSLSQAQCGQLLSQGLTGCSPVGPEQPLTADTQKLGSLIGTNWQCLCRPVLCAQSCELIVMPNDPPGQINTNNPLSRLSSSLTIENLELGKTVAQSDGGGVQGEGSNSDTQLLLSSYRRRVKTSEKQKRWKHFVL